WILFDEIRLAKKVGGRAGTRQPEFRVAPVGVVVINPVSRVGNEQPEQCNVAHVDVKVLRRIVSPHHPALPQDLPIAKNMEHNARLIAANLVVHPDRSGEGRSGTIEVDEDCAHRVRPDAMIKSSSVNSESMSLNRSSR